MNEFPIWSWMRQEWGFILGVMSPILILTLFVFTRVIDINDYRHFSVNISFLMFGLLIGMYLSLSSQAQILQSSAIFTLYQKNLLGFLHKKIDEMFTVQIGTETTEFDKINKDMANSGEEIYDICLLINEKNENLYIKSWLSLCLAVFYLGMGLGFLIAQSWVS